MHFDARGPRRFDGAHDLRDAVLRRRGSSAKMSS